MAHNRGLLTDLVDLQLGLVPGLCVILGHHEPGLGDSLHLDRDGGDGVLGVFLDIEDDLA